MSVVGIDFGNFKSVVAVARNRGIDIVTNEVSNRFTPSMLGFVNNERLLGEAAKTQEVMNLRNTVTDIRRLLGRSVKEADVQTFEKPFALYDLVDTEEGVCGAKVTYQGEQKTFSMTQLAAMYLTDMKFIAEAALQTPVHDVVISVPPYYTDQQRHALMNAAEVAGLNPLRLMNEPAAAALVYGITRVRDLPEKDKEPRHVVFFDMGQSATVVSVVAFTQEKAVVKATVCDRHLGGRNVDMELVKHFAQEILAKHKVDVYSKPKALLRLRTACERVKKMLSANSVAAFNVENLTDDVDVRSQMTRDDLEKMIQHLTERIDVPLRVALHIADVRKDNIEFVELIGGSTRVPAFKSRVAAFFNNREGILSTTLNQDEAVARGCAFQCAMISPLFKVRDYALKDVNSYDIKVSWKTDSDESISETLVFKEGDGIPCTKALTSYRTSGFEITALYANASQLTEGAPTHIAIFLYTVGGKSSATHGNGRSNTAKFRIKDVPVGKDGKPSEVKVKLRLNANGIVNVESAQLIEDIEDGSDAAATTTDASTNSPAPAADGAAPDAAAAAAAAAEEKEKKRRVKKTDLPVESATSALAPEVVQRYREAEVAMIANDKLIADTRDKKNNLEEYIYDMRSKIEGAYGPFIDPAIKDDYLKKLADTETWLYDEGEDATKSVFVDRLSALQKISQPVIERFQEAEVRPKAAAELEATMAQLRQAAESWDEKYAHIEPSEKAKLIDEVTKKQSWLQSQLRAQSQLKPHETPVLRAAQITVEKSALQAMGNAILNKPKPAPKPQETSAAPAADGAKVPTPAADGDGKDGSMPVDDAPPLPEDKTAAPNAGGMDLDID